LEKKIEGKTVLTSIPDLGLGLWNAWILFVSTLLLPFLFSLISKRLNRPPFDEQERKVHTVLQIISIISLIYSFFLAFGSDASWFMIGFIIYLFGMILISVSGLTFEITTTDGPVTDGIYRFSRNPQYLGSFLSFMGIGIAYSSLIFVILAIVFLDMQQILVDAEERWCLQEYGDFYRQYMIRTPKWIGIPQPLQRKKVATQYS